MSLTEDRSPAAEQRFSVLRNHPDIADVVNDARASVAGDQIGAAEAALERALQAAESLGDEAVVAAIQLEIGELRLRKGDHGAARASAVAALEMFGRLRTPLHGALACNLLGRVLRDSGATELAERRLAEAAAMAEEAGAAGIQVDSLLELALLYRGDARIAEALEAANRAYGLLTRSLSEDLEDNTGRDRLDLLEDAYLEIAGEVAAMAQLGNRVRAEKGRRMAHIVRLLLQRLGSSSQERMPVVFAAALAGGAWDEEDGIEGALHARVQGLDLPWNVSPALEAGGRPPEWRALELASLIEPHLRRDAPAATTTAESLLSRLEQHRSRFGAELLDLVSRIDWTAAASVHWAASPQYGPPAPASGSTGRTTILVVDDDAEVRTILSHYFTARGYAVEVAETGDGLFSILGRVKPDLVLLDVMLPGQDGRAILDRLRASLSWSHIPVIMITGLSDPAEATRALRAGADDWVQKPIDPPALQARIERLLSLRRALREAEKHRARQELLLEIIRELTGSLDTDNLLDRLVRRIAEATGVAKCSLLLADLAEGKARLVTAYDNPTVHDLQLDLDRYPEIRRALETRRPVVVNDPYSDPLFNDVRRKWATAVNVRSSAVIPLLVDDSPIGVFFIRTILDEPPLDPATVDFAIQVTEAAGKALEYARLFEGISADLRSAEAQVNEYRALSMTDPLTGLANRAGLESRGTDLFLAARAFDHPLSVIMLDLDNFKRLNDTHGHAAGDEILREVGRALGDFAEEQDLVARYGGDEFCLILPYREIDDASRRGRILYERLREIRIPGFDGPPVEASAGVATYPLSPSQTLTDLIARADQALYRAKTSGGGHLQVAFGGAPAAAQGEP